MCLTIYLSIYLCIHLSIFLPLCIFFRFFYYTHTCIRIVNVQFFYCYITNDWYTFKVNMYVMSALSPRIPSLSWLIHQYQVYQVPRYNFVPPITHQSIAIWKWNFPRTQSVCLRSVGSAESLTSILISYHFKFLWALNLFFVSDFDQSKYKIKEMIWKKIYKWS